MAVCSCNFCNQLVQPLRVLGIELCNVCFASACDQQISVPHSLTLQMLFCVVFVVKPAGRNEQRTVSRMRTAWEEVERRAAIMGGGEKGVEEAMRSLEELGDIGFSVLSDEVLAKLQIRSKLQLRSKQTDIWVDAQKFPAVKAFGDQMMTDDVNQSEADIIYFLNAAEVELDGSLQEAKEAHEGKQCNVAAGLQKRLLAAIVQAAPHQATDAFHKRLLQAIEGREASLPATSFLKQNEDVLSCGSLKFAFRCWISSCFK